MFVSSPPFGNGALTSSEKIIPYPAARSVGKPGSTTHITIIQGDACSTLQTLPDGCTQCVITSPPYWGVRDYRVKGQIGLEREFGDYLARLLAVFAEVHRVLRPDGVMWLNIGDVYASGNRTYRTPDPKNAQRAMGTRPRTPPGLKPKDLVGVPWRLAFALQEAGWYLRTEIIWQKTNAMPESVKDRPSRNHEYLFLFAKTKSYKFSRARLDRGLDQPSRSVWSTATAKSVLEGHHATFPERLITPCIEATTNRKDLVLDPFCGSGTSGRVCARLRRPFLGVEIKPAYAQASARNIQAVRAATTVRLFEQTPVKLVAAQNVSRGTGVAA